MFQSHLDRQTISKLAQAKASPDIILSKRNELNHFWLSSDAATKLQCIKGFGTHIKLKTYLVSHRICDVAIAGENELLLISSPFYFHRENKIIIQCTTMYSNVFA